MGKDRGAEAAIAYLRRIQARCETLRLFPESGRHRDDLRPGLRVIGFERRVAIVYAISSTGDVEIGRIFYGGRDYELIIASGEDN